MDTETVVVDTFAIYGLLTVGDKIIPELVLFLLFCDI